MTVSLVIPVYNAQDTIKPCLEAIAGQERKPEQVILVDNGSNDNTMGIIKDFMKNNPGLEILLLSEDKKGPGAARNKGLAFAREDYIVFTDSDCFPRPDWIKNMLGLYQRYGVDAIGGLTYIYKPATASQKLEALDLVIPGELRGAIIGDKQEALFGRIMGTFNCSCKKSVLDATGGFDESFFPAGEDVDLTIRIVEKGFRVMVWHPEMAVWHMPRKTYFLFLKKIFQYRFALALLLKKHFKKHLFIELPGLGLRKFGFFRGTVITRDSIFLSVLIIIGIIFHKAAFWIFIFALGAILIRLFKTFYDKRGIIAAKITLLELSRMVCMDLFKKFISLLAKVYSGVKNGSFYL